jgi:hypothetical protein
MAPIVAPERISDTAVSDLLIRCRDDDYHVDRSIMCHHAQFFAKVYSKINYPVRLTGSIAPNPASLTINRECPSA